MTCKDCVHYDVCKRFNFIFDYHKILSPIPLPKICGDFFKNKADFVEVKHGYWEEVQGGAFRCSECHHGAIVNIFNEWRLTKFCPNCGADMRKEGADNG